MVIIRAVSIKFNSLEKLLVIGILVGLFAPLSLKFPIFQLFVWNIPAFLLFMLIFVRYIIFREPIYGRHTLWDLNIYFLIFTLALMTYSNQSVQPNLGSFHQLAFTLLLVRYFRGSFGHVTSIKFIVNFAIIAVFIQSFVSIIQIMTLSKFGVISSFFGQVVLEDLREIGSGDRLMQIGGTIGHPNSIGNWIIFLFPFVVIAPYLTNKNRIFWWFTRLTLIMGIITLLLTFSIGSIGIFFIVSIIFLPIYIKLKRRYREKANISLFKIFITLCIVTIIVIASLFLTYFIEQLNLGLMHKIDIKLFGDGTSSGSYRIEMMIAAAKYFFTHPIWGIGWENSKYIYTMVDTAIPDFWQYRPHNTYCIMAVEGGIFALISYSILTIYPLLRILRILITYRNFDMILFAFLFVFFAAIALNQVYVTPFAVTILPIFAMFTGTALGYIDKTYTNPVSINNED